MVETEYANKVWHFNAHTLKVDCKEIQWTELFVLINTHPHTQNENKNEKRQ